MAADDVLDHFADTYPEARARFELAAAQAGAVLTSYQHPSATGPDGGSLSIDVACFGRPDAPRALLVLSGTHGGEGYAGCAAQIAFMRTGALQALPAEVRVVLVHGLNPYGFAHWTRTTEHNVDLNRNFIDFGNPPPANARYREVHDALCPAHWDNTTLVQTRQQLDGWIENHGRQAWTDTIMAGQYDEPTGLNYGGRAPEWSHLTLQRLCATHLAGVQRLGFIDWHTGLGQPGQPFFLCFNEHRDALWERACRWWGRERVETSDGFDGATRPRYTGLVFHGVQRFVAPAAMCGAVIEFGTAGVQETFDQVRLDRWLKFGDRPDEPERLRALRRGVRDAFTPTDPAWRRGIVAHARQIQLQLLDGVTAWTD